MRKVINMDDFHFVSAKNTVEFKIKTQEEPFICNTKLEATKVDTLLK